MPTASRPLNTALVRGSSVPSNTVATWPNRIAVPLRSDTVRFAKSCASPSRPLRRIDCSSQRAVEPPNGSREILLADGLHDVGDAHAVRLQVGWMHLHRHLALDPARHAHLAHSRNRAQVAHDPGIGDPRERRRQESSST